MHRSRPLILLILIGGAFLGWAGVRDGQPELIIPIMMVVMTSLPFIATPLFQFRRVHIVLSPAGVEYWGTLFSFVRRGRVRWEELVCVELDNTAGFPFGSFVIRNDRWRVYLRLQSGERRYLGAFYDPMSVHKGARELQAFIHSGGRSVGG